MDIGNARNTTGMCFPGRFPDGSVPGSCDLSGERPVNAPPWSVELGVELPFAIGGVQAAARLDSGENFLDETVVHFDSVLNFFNDASYQSFVALPRRYAVTLRASL